MTEETGIIYSSYKFTKLAWLGHVLLGGLYFFAMGMIFYQNLWLSLIASLGTVFYVKEARKKAVKTRREKLLLQFREGMYALGSSLSAGRSVEQAFNQSLRDLKVLFPEGADIVEEWQFIVHKISLNVPVEDGLEDFAARADMEDIHNFVSVFVMAKRSGGDLIHIIKDTTRLINEKLEIKKEIEVMVTQKKFEQRILSFIIPGMILFFTLTSPGFLAPLYSDLSGRLIMTIALFLYSISARIGRRIVEIEV